VYEHRCPNCWRIYRQGKRLGKDLQPYKPFLRSVAKKGTHGVLLAIMETGMSLETAYPLLQSIMRLAERKIQNVKK